MTPPTLLLVHTSCPQELAPTLVQSLLELRLIACAHTSPPLQSAYTWQGAVHHAQEVALTLKTSSHLKDPLFAHLAALHPYEVPEIFALPALHVSPPYLDWVLAVTRPPDPDPTP